jgi:hypothetical protein
MTTRTRYFLIASLSVLIGGVGAGLVAYYVGYPASAFAQQDWQDDLRLVPRDAALVAYADVQDVMASDLRQRIRSVLPFSEDRQREFENQTGIKVETDIDHVVACAAPAVEGGQAPAFGLMLARGRFDEVKIETLMREHGASVESYKGKRLIAAPDAAASGPSGAPDGSGSTGRPPLALAFIEPGLAAVGSASLVRQAIDLHGGGTSITANREMMDLVGSLEDGNLWAVGRFDVLADRSRLTALAGPLPPIDWFSVSGNISGGIRGVLRAETRDEAAATNLRDLARGSIALLKLRASTGQPGLQMLVDSLELGGSGTTVALSFEAPATIVDVFGHAGP